jgi:hypothetical protein
MGVADLRDEVAAASSARPVFVNFARQNADMSVDCTVSSLLVV